MAEGKKDFKNELECAIMELTLEERKLLLKTIKEMKENGKL